MREIGIFGYRDKYKKGLNYLRKADYLMKAFGLEQGRKNPMDIENQSNLGRFRVNCGMI